MKVRLNCYFVAELADQLAEVSARQGVHRSQLVEAAVAAYLAPDVLARKEDAYIRRLDRLSQQVAALKQDYGLGIEAHAAFVQLWLRMTAQLPDSVDPIARARGAKRFEKYVDYVRGCLPDGGTFRRTIAAEIWSRDPMGNGNGAAHEDEHAVAP